MATAALSVEPQEMECPVCHEYFTDPKILPCAHLLCRHCLISWLKSHTDAQCPLCRCVIADPKDRASKSCEELADVLPTDVTMACLVDSARKLNKDHVCCVCEDVAATFICIDCNEMMCSACHKAHKKFMVSKHHTTEDLTNMTAERLASSGHVYCTAHASEQAKLFCPSHGVPICQLCATSTHRACPEVTKLEDKLAEARKVLGELVEMLSEGESKLEHAISQLDQHLIDVDKKTEAIIVDIDTTFDRLQKSMESRRKQLKEMAVKAKSEAKTSVQDGKTVFVERRGKLTSHKQLIKRAQGVPNPSCADDVKTSLKTRVEGLDRSAILPELSQDISIPLLTLEQEAINRVVKELEELGQVKNVPALSSLQRRTFCFHTNHGQNIVLSNNQQTAERVRGDQHGIVLTSKPMEINLLYEVQIDQNDPTSGNKMFVGVVTVDPAQLILPGRSTGLDEPTSVVLDSVCYRAFGTRFIVPSGCPGKKLKNMPVGSRAGLYINSDRRLHFVFDGRDQVIVANNIPYPCYAFFDVRYSYKKITALPLTAMP